MSYFDQFEGVQPENDLPEEIHKPADVRVKSLIMLFVFILPTVLIAVEVMTGMISGWWIESVEPVLPDVKLVRF